MRWMMILLFSAIFVGMTIVTVIASMERPVWDNGHLMRDPWFVATLCDAYFGFLTFSVWVFLREQSMLAKIGWFIAIMLLGNFAMSAYAVMQLIRLEKNRPLTDVLLPKR